jgi:hypothetical protein
MDLMKARGVRTLRWWVYTDFVESPLWQGEGAKRRCIGLPQGWVANFIKAADAAHARGIRLYPVFSSFDPATRARVRDLVSAERGLDVDGMAEALAEGAELVLVRA